MTKPKIGDIIPFGEYNWRVLDVQGDKALIITEDVLEHQAYHAQGGEVTWETCDLRKYLNGEFLSKFDDSRIALTTNQNPNNPWFNNTNGGNITQDKIFLLCLEEVCRYFGDSTDNLRNKPSEMQIDESIAEGSSEFLCISDNNNYKRIAKHKGEDCWWWLRSPGCISSFATAVYDDGRADVDGVGTCDDGVGVRPALWLKLCGGNEHELS
jgi:hypothetical protein